MKFDIEIFNDRFTNLLNPAQELEQLETGFDFVEGPIWNPKESSLIFSDILGNSLHRWTEKDGTLTMRRNSYMANGNAYDLRGRVLSCEHATSRVTRTDFSKDGNLEILATHYNGRELNSPNDIVISSSGMIYFTDPIAGRSEAYGVPREPELDFSGVYQLDPHTGNLIILVEDLDKPNGLCFSRDEKQLFVNDSNRLHIRVFDMNEDGGLSNGATWAEVTGEGAGVPDGMKIDSEENIYCCGPGGIYAFDKDGNRLGRIKMPEQAANLCFGGQDLKSLYITASTSIYKISVNIPGHATFLG